MIPFDAFTEIRLREHDEDAERDHLLDDFGKCSECHEIICVEKAAAHTQNTQPENNEMLYKAFGTHVKLKHAYGQDHRPISPVANSSRGIAPAKIRFCMTQVG